MGASVEGERPAGQARRRGPGAWCALALLVPLLTGCSSPAPQEMPFDPVLEWTTHPGAATGRTEVATAAVGPLIFVIGGFTSGSLATSMVEVFHAAEERWVSATPYPIPIHHTAAVSHGGIVYVFGGYTTSAFVPTDLAFQYDPGSGLWTPLPRLPAARGAHAAAVVDGSVYLVGGVGANGSLIGEVHILHLETRTWTTGEDMPTPRDHLGAAPLDGKLYVVGGRSQSLTTNTGALEVYDPGRNAWTPLPDMPTPRGGLAAAAWEGRLVVAGGERPDGTFAAVEAYEPAGAAWEALPDLPTPRHGLGAAVAGDRFYTLLGGPRPGLSTSDATESLGLFYEL